MLDPDDKLEADSTWELPPRRQWILKFLASLALLGFLVGLMIGRVVEPPPALQPYNRLLQLQSYADGLAVCFAQTITPQVRHEQGAYYLWFADTQGRNAQGEFVLPLGQLVQWQVESRDTGVQVVFVGLQALQGQWSVRQDQQQWCTDIRISAASDTQ